MKEDEKKGEGTDAANKRGAVDVKSPCEIEMCEEYRRIREGGGVDLASG